VLLADDRRSGGWRPQPEHEALWGRLRVALLGPIWEARCAQAHLGRDAVGAAARANRTAAAVLRRLTRAATMDWQRVVSDIRFLSEECPSSWFRGRDPRLKLDTFLRQWSMGGRFCTASLQPQPAFQLLVSLAWPVVAPGV
jgi:hypothetical protein